MLNENNLCVCLLEKKYLGQIRQNRSLFFFQFIFQMLCFSQILTQNGNGYAYALMYLCMCLINEFQENFKSDLITCLQFQRPIPYKNF